MAPTIEQKPLTEYVDRRLEVLVALLNARRRAAFTAPKEVVDLDPHRFKLMSSRLNKAMAAVTGASVGLSAESSALIPGEEARLIAVATNSGLAEIQIRKLKFRGFGVERDLDTADKMLPGTEASAEIKITPPKTWNDAKRTFR